MRVNSLVADEDFNDNCGVPNFLRQNNLCYQILAEKTYNRSRALEACRELTDRTEVNLVQIHSEDELIFVNSLSCLPVYVGAKREVSRKTNFYRVLH